MFVQYDSCSIFDTIIILFIMFTVNTLIRITFYHALVKKTLEFQILVLAHLHIPPPPPPNKAVCGLETTV